MESPPRDILIIGSGVFGLGTAWALAKRPFFATSSITVVDDARGVFPPRDSASSDSSRIVRADYADPAYAELAVSAQLEWRKQGENELGGQGRYSESGLLMTAYRSVAVEEKPRPGGMKTAWEYSRASFANVKHIAEGMGVGEKVREVKTAEEIGDVLGMGVKGGGGGGRAGDWGYVNELSGWADAERSMDWLGERVRETGRVEFVDGRVEELLTERGRVVGVRMDSDSEVEKRLRADVVVVAAGAWTGSLVDLRGRVEATGQPLGYLDLTEEEFAKARSLPTVLNFSSGLFIIPPRERVLKVARHTFGYLNPTTITTALPPSPSHERKPIVVSMPLTRRNGGDGRLPRSAEMPLRQALRDLTPLTGLEGRPWRATRLCWYADTRDGEWLVDWHPGWGGLFVATGDSGHAFKFLPVLGEKVVDCMVGRGGDLGGKWRWREVDPELGDGGEGDESMAMRWLVTDDGSRGGEMGLILEEELAL